MLAGPAMAQERPAVTVPDTAPQADSDASTAPATSPAAQAPPAAADKTVASPRYRNDGPKVSVTGVPASFTPDGDWTQLTVTVDNRDRLPVTEFVATVGVTQYDSLFQARHIEAQVRQADGTWKSVTPQTGGGGNYYDINLPSRGVSPGDHYTADVRIRFVAGTPAAPFELYVSGDGKDESGRVVSPSTYFDSRVGDAKPGGGDGEETPATTGPKIGLTGLPQAGFKAGGDWREFSMRVDNSGQEAIDDYQLELVLWVKNGAFRQSDIKLEVYAPDASGTWAWHPVVSDGSEEVWVHELATVDIEKNEVFDLKLRLKFDAKTTPHDISLHTGGQNGWDEGSVHSEEVSHASKVTAADSDATPGPGGNTPKPDGGHQPKPGGNDPKPDGGSTPVDGAGSGSNAGSGTSGGTGGQLAETGTDAATSWALGGAGTALALGAALVAGTGRRRRTT